MSNNGIKLDSQDQLLLISVGAIIVGGVLLMVLSKGKLSKKTEEFLEDQETQSFGKNLAR